MATTITAGNATNGAAISSDNTGTLAIKTGSGAGTTAISIDASQNAAITGTLQVAGVTTNMYPIVSGTAVTLTNQTAPELSTTIPSWVKRITVMFNGVSLSNSAPYGIVQIGSGSYATSGYINTFFTAVNAASCVVNARTDGFGVINFNAATDTASGHLVLTLISGNSWVASGVLSNTGNVRGLTTAGNITLGGALDRIRITTTDGTTQFDAGTVNIFWE